MKDKRLRNTKCPTCGKPLDAAGLLSGVDDIPNPKDMTVCIYCSNVAQFQSDLSLKHVPESDYASFGPKVYTGIRRTLLAVNAAKSESESDKKNKFFTEEMLSRVETRFKQDRHKKSDNKNN